MIAGNPSLRGESYHKIHEAENQFTTGFPLFEPILFQPPIKIKRRCLCNRLIIIDSSHDILALTAENP